MEDMVVVWVGEDVRSVNRMRASVAGHRVDGIRGQRCGICNHIFHYRGAGSKVRKLRDCCATVGGGRRAGVKVSRVRGVESLRR